MPHLLSINGTRRRVAVTGLGLVTPLGVGPDAVRARLVAGASAASRPVPGTPALRVAEISGFAARPHFRHPKALKLTDRKTQLAVAAAVLAVADAGLADELARDEWAIVLGCSASDLQVEELARALGSASPESAVDDLPAFARAVLGGLNPLWLLINLPNMVGAHVGIQLASNGPNHTLTGDWIAGAQALGEAALSIASGERTVALAGGAEAPLDPFDLGCLASHPRLARNPPLTVAEGAAVWVLEEREHALRRGARMWGEICGYSTAAASAGDVRGSIHRVAAAALDAAGWAADDLEIMARAGGPGHPWESEERLALVDLLAARQRPRAAPSDFEIASCLGQTLAASGAVHGALVLAELRSRRAPERPGVGRGLALAIGTCGQSAALALAGAEGS